MYNSGITAKELIDNLIEESDVAPNIPLATWLLWLSQLEYMLYSEVVQEQAIAEVEARELKVVSLTDLSFNEYADVPVSPEDVLYVYADDTQLIKSTPASGVIFPDCWYINGNSVWYNTIYEPEKITVVCKVRPIPKVEGNYINEIVMVPYGFIDMVKAKLRGEAYKLANEDLLAAKWLNDYNVLLENFKAFIQKRDPQFGI